MIGTGSKPSAAGVPWQRVRFEQAADPRSELLIERVASQPFEQAEKVAASDIELALRCPARCVAPSAEGQRVRHRAGCSACSSAEALPVDARDDGGRAGFGHIGLRRRIGRCAANHRRRPAADPVPNQPPPRADLGLRPGVMQRSQAKAPAWVSTKGSGVVKGAPRRITYQFSVHWRGGSRNGRTGSPIFISSVSCCCERQCCKERAIWHQHSVQ